MQDFVTHKNSSLNKKKNLSIIFKTIDHNETDKKTDCDPRHKFKTEKTNKNYHNYHDRVKS